MITFPWIDVNSLLERCWWLIKELGIGYDDLMMMPLEELDWFYDRQVQYEIDKQQAQGIA